jgi:cell division transport system permease protein
MIVSVFFSLANNINFILQQLEQTIGITVFIYDDVDALGVLELHERLQGIEHVSSLTYVSREDAFEIVLATYDDPSILDGVPVENFPRSFNIELSDIRYHDVVVAYLERLYDYGVERIRQAQGIVNMITTITNMVYWVSFSLIAVLAGVSVIIITNTIRITVNARQVEINIMKFVGATDWFIRWPFLIEGILIGVLGSLLPVALIWFGYTPVIRMVQDGMPLIEFIEFVPGNQIYMFLFPFVMCLGAVIGATGSGTAIRKHLRV